jgi:hypothetical protein
VNKVVVPADDLSRQALSAQAEDLAVEDCLLVLEKAMLQGKLAPDVYMKQVSAYGECCIWSNVNVPGTACYYCERLRMVAEQAGARRVHEAGTITVFATMHEAGSDVNLPGTACCCC